MAEVLALLPEEPRAVGPYHLEGRLGAGGQGTVYVGRGDGDALVAIKLLHPHLIADHKEQQRFLREVETAQRVAPFCTAQVLDFGFVGDRPYIVSEFIDGPSLQTAVRDGGPRRAAALQRLAVNTATALAAIHEAEVVHRDFKPGNVLLGPDGPVVIDFGIARALDLSQSVVSSQPIGSPAYMAPEQIAGRGVGPAVDVFAWGATMVYAATGQRAFVGDSIPGILHLILQGEPDLGGLQGALRALLAECLDKDPARRPTAAQVLERLRALPAPAWLAVPGASGVSGGSGVPTAPGAAVGGPAQRAGGRRPGGLIMGTAVAALLATAVTGYLALAPIASGSRAAGASPAVSQPVAMPSSTVPSSAPPTPELPSEPSTSAPATPTAAVTPAPRAARRSQAAKAVSTAGASPKSRPSKQPTDKTLVEPTTAPRTKKPTRNPEPRPTPTEAAPPPPSDDPPAPSQGTITFNDVHAYCKTQGQNMGGGNWDNLWCFGGAKITPTTVCQWKYQGRDAVAERPVYAAALEVTCRLS
ncbi:serine/threonine protein kinase [Nonomuraea sp. NPDC059194]|uniref:serine/threonine protein kinase n=1 Tax=Nonomuraea sp. NPDC059194 TaxID=3346764 RepID=UPI0036CF77B6